MCNWREDDSCPPILSRPLRDEHMYHGFVVHLDSDYRAIMRDQKHCKHCGEPVYHMDGLKCRCTPGS